MKHTFRMGEPLSFGEAMKRTARALKRIGSPVAEVANARTLLQDRGPGNASNR